MTTLCQAAKAAVSPPQFPGTRSPIQFIHRNKEASDTDEILKKIGEKTRENQRKERRKDQFDRRERGRLILLDCLRRGRKLGLISSAAVFEVEACHKASEVWLPPECQPCIEARRVAVHPDYCSFSLCPHTQHKRATRIHAVIAPVVAEALEQGKPVKFLTLTAPNFDTLDEGQIHSIIRKSFTKMRHRRAFKAHCNGGGYSIEATHEGHGYHVHLHALVECDWWDQAEISREWFSCLPPEWQIQINQAQPASHQGRAIVYIQEADARSIHEFCKYLAKGSSFLSDPHVVAEYLRSIKGRRLFEAFGDWRGKVHENRKSRAEKLRESHLCPHGFLMERVGLQYLTPEEASQGFAHLDERAFSFYLGVHFRRQRERAPPTD